MATMPDLTGLSVSQATTSLILAGAVPDNGLLPTANLANMGYFDNWPISVVWVSGFPPGKVASQVPAPGATVPNAGSSMPFQTATVILTVGNYPMSVSDRYSAGGYS